MKKKMLASSLIVMQVLQSLALQAQAQTAPVIAKAVAFADESPDNLVFSVAERAIGASAAKYANDPSAAEIEQLKSLLPTDMWVLADGQLTVASQNLRKALRSAHVQGLNPDDYWSVEMESLSQQTQAGKAQEFSDKATAALLRYATHINGGRLDPQSVDSVNLKFKVKKISDLTALSTAVKKSPASLETVLNSYAPQTPQYRKLKKSLSRLEHLKEKGWWKKITAPKKSLRVGDRNPVIADIRIHLNNLGYFNAGSGDLYDGTFDALIKEYKKTNGLTEATDARFWSSINQTIDSRIEQISINMEKLRWLPADARTRFSFINLAAQEIEMYENDGIIRRFRTINGRPDRKTPSMIQEIRQTILMPFWRVPTTLLQKDKLPRIMAELNTRPYYDNYFFRANLWAEDKVTKRLSQNGVDFYNFEKKYYMVQGPGYDNSLGVVKFPLNNINGRTNPDDIYLHDTNERHLFKNAVRYNSSGCIRLEKPLEFAADVLRDNQIIMDRRMSYEDTRQNLYRIVPSSVNPYIEVPFEQYNQIYKLNKGYLVYIMYMTAAQNDNGSLRFFEDTYGIDALIKQALANSR